MLRRLEEDREPRPAVPRPPEPASPAAGVLGMQHAVGNAVVSRFVRELTASGLAPAMIVPGAAAEAVEVGMFAAEPAGGMAVGGTIEQLPDPPRNEFDEMDGDVRSEVHACVFVDGGRAGEGAVWFGGGDGGKGLQGLGDVTLVAPEYEGAEPAKDGEKATAWIKPGTGTATVTRSYRGVVNGDNGTWFFTAAARTRVDTHEKLHVAATKVVHDTFIDPLEKRVKEHTGQAKARAGGSTKAEAIAQLKTYIDWNDAIAKFRAEDTKQNTPGPPLGPVDAADMARADFIKDYGARKVAGKDYAHYADIPPGPAAVAPAPSP